VSARTELELKGSYTTSQDATRHRVHGKSPVVEWRATVAGRARLMPLGSLRARLADTLRRLLSSGDESHDEAGHAIELQLHGLPPILITARGAQPPLPTLDLLLCSIRKSGKNNGPECAN